MTMKANPAALVSALICTLLVSNAQLSSVRAEESPFRRSLTERGLKEGLGRDEVRTLSVVTVSDRAKTADRLREQVASGAFGKLLAFSLDKPAEDGKKTVSFIGDEGYVQVYADGSRFRLRGDIEKVTRAEAHDGKERIDIERLERLARDFVAGPLKSFVSLGEGESLSFLGSRYFREGGASVADAKGKEYLVANIAILGRVIDGIPVVGSGSKIAVWLTPEGEVVGADVDWPTYKLGAAEPLLSADELRQRVAAASIPAADNGKMKVVRFECGYVDLGATRRSAETPIQPGCAVSYIGREDIGAGAAFARQDFVPAAKKVYPDERWPLATYIAQNGEPKAGQPWAAPKSEIPPADPSPEERDLPSPKN